MATTPEVTTQELAEACEGGARVIDVRSTEDYERGHIPGAVNVPIDTVLSAPEQFAGQDVHVVCGGGSRSKRAADAMNGAGARAISVAGGTRGWIAEGRPVEGGAER